MIALYCQKVLGILYAKLFSTVRNSSSGMGLIYMVQLVRKAYNACTQAAVLGSIQISLQVYVFYNYRAVMFEGIGIREKGMLRSRIKLFYARSDQAVVLDEAGDGHLHRDLLSAAGAVMKALSYVASVMFSTLHSMVGNSQLCTLKDEEMSDWPEVKSVNDGS